MNLQQDFKINLGKRVYNVAYETYRNPEFGWKMKISRKIHNYLHTWTIHVDSKLFVALTLHVRQISNPRFFFELVIDALKGQSDNIFKNTTFVYFFCDKRFKVSDSALDPLYQPKKRFKDEDTLVLKIVYSKNSIYKSSKAFYLLFDHSMAKLYNNSPIVKKKESHLYSDFDNSEDSESDEDSDSNDEVDGSNNPSWTKLVFLGDIQQKLMSTFIPTKDKNLFQTYQPTAFSKKDEGIGEMYQTPAIPFEECSTPMVQIGSTIKRVFGTRYCSCISETGFEKGFRYKFSIKILERKQRGSIYIGLTNHSDFSEYGFRCGFSPNSYSIHLADMIIYGPNGIPQNYNSRVNHCPIKDDDIIHFYVDLLNMKLSYTVNFGKRELMYRWSSKESKDLKMLYPCITLGFEKYECAIVKY